MPGILDTKPCVPDKPISKINSKRLILLVSTRCCIDCSALYNVLLLAGKIHVSLPQFDTLRKHFMRNVRNNSLTFHFIYILTRITVKNFVFQHVSSVSKPVSYCYLTETFPITVFTRILLIIFELLEIISIGKLEAKLTMAFNAGFFFCVWLIKNPRHSVLYTVFGRLLQYEENRIDGNRLRLTALSQIIISLLFNSVRRRLMLTAYDTVRRGSADFPKPRSRFKSFDAKRVTWINFHTEDSQMPRRII